MASRNWATSKSCSAAASRNDLQTLSWIKGLTSGSKLQCTLRVIGCQQKQQPDQQQDCMQPSLSAVPIHTLLSPGESWLDLTCVQVQRETQITDGPAEQIMSQVPAC